MTTLNSLLPVRRVESQVEQLSPSVDTAFVLPSAANMLGKVWTIVNSGTGNAAILVQSSSGATLGVVNAGSTGLVTPLIDFPTLASHWQLVGTWKEYAFNTTSNDADDTTSFGHGFGGGTIGSFTTQRNKRVRFYTPILATDKIEVEINSTSGSGSTWTPLYQTRTGNLSYQNQTGVLYGIGIIEQNSTDIDIQFETYAKVGNGTYGTAGVAWSTIAGYMWRVRKTTN